MEESSYLTKDVSSKMLMAQQKVDVLIVIAE